MPNGTESVLSWFGEQEAKVKAKFARIFDLLQEHGISVGMPHVRSITRSRLFEIRVEQDTNIYRIFYFSYTGQRLILLHGFQKKTQKTPKQELEIAKARMKDFLEIEKQQQFTSDTKKAKSQKRRKKK